MLVVLEPHLQRHQQSEALHGPDEDNHKWIAQSKWQTGSENIVNAFATTLHHISCLAFRTFLGVTAL